MQPPAPIESLPCPVAAIRTPWRLVGRVNLFLLRLSPTVFTLWPSPHHRAALVLRTRLAHTFRQFPLLDPELPAGLVPPPIHRADAVRLFHDLYTALAPAAMRRFDEVMQP